MAAALPTAAVVAALLGTEVDHRFRGVGLPAIEGQTEWERKHGILPGGIGFVYDYPGITNESFAELLAKSGASSVDHLHHVRRRRQTETCPSLQGLFVRPCQVRGTFTYRNAAGQNVTHNVTQRDTRFYAGAPGLQTTYTLDRTYYVGEGTGCYPATMETFFKMVLHGMFKPHGPAGPSIRSAPSPPWRPGACKAEMAWSDSQITLGDNPQGHALASLFNANCPCGIRWRATGDPTTHNVSVSNCQNISQISNTSQAYYWCNLIGGGHDYFNFQWDTSLNHYITSRDDFQETGWQNQLIPGYTRERIPATSNNFPADCTEESPLGPDRGLALFQKCNPPVCNGGFRFDAAFGKCVGGDGSMEMAHPGIPLAELVCDTCVGFECDGCLFDQVTGVWHPGVSNNTWQDCCPCFYLAGESIDHDWEKVHC